MEAVRRLWASVLLSVSSACALADGVPATDPIAPLIAGNYAEVDRLMQTVQDDYKRAAITDEELLAAFRPFYDVDTSQAQRLDEWVSQYPKSYVARLARGIYYKHLGFKRRGTKFMDETSDAQIDGMREAHAIAAADLYDSMELDEKPLLSYFHAIDIDGPFWRRPAKQLLKDANAVDPDNFIVRHEFLLSLQSRWGGSVQQMRAFVRDNERALQPDQFRRLEAEVLVEQAWVEAYRHNDPVAAEHLYRSALAIDPANRNANWYVLYALVKRRECDAAIAIATKLIEQPDADVAEAFARRGYCYFQLDKGIEGLTDYRQAAELGNAWAQRDLARVYWQGKYVERDIELARNWLQKSAEQGDEKAQREMERTFGVTITAQPSKQAEDEKRPDEWRRIADAVGYAVALAFVLGWLGRSRYREVGAGADSWLMRYPRSNLIVGVLGVLLFGFAAWWAFWSIYSPFLTTKFAIPAALAVAALYLVVQFFMERHELTKEGMLFRRVSGRRLQLKWADLRSVRFAPSMQWFRLQSSAGEVVRVSSAMTGLRRFAREVLTHAPHAIADEDTGELLEAIIGDLAPQA